MAVSQEVPAGPSECGVRKPSRVASHTSRLHHQLGMRTALCIISCERHCCPADWHTQWTPADTPAQIRTLQSERTENLVTLVCLVYYTEFRRASVLKSKVLLSSISRVPLVPRVSIHPNSAITPSATSDRGRVILKKIIQPSLARNLKTDKTLGKKSERLI